MSSNDKFCLKWNDFQENIVSSYHDLRKETDFSDVTLVCEEEYHVEAHRIILTACSPFFNSVLKRNKHSHPMIYMRGMKGKDLSAIVDFIYHGEANIYQEDLDGFLALAEELKLKGLTGVQNMKTDESVESNNPPEAEVSWPLKKNKAEIKDPPKFDYTSEMMNITTRHNTLDDSNSLVPVVDGQIIIDPDTSTEDHEAIIGSMMERITDPNYSWKCKSCGKLTKGSATQMKRHIETHLEGLSYPCRMCGKVSRSSHALQAHMSSYHKN